MNDRFGAGCKNLHDRVLLGIQANNPQAGINDIVLAKADCEQT